MSKPLWQRWEVGIVLGLSGLAAHWATIGSSYEEWGKTCLIMLLSTWGLLRVFSDRFHNRRFWCVFAIGLCFFAASWFWLIPRLSGSNLSRYSLVGFLEALLLTGVISALVDHPL